MTFENLLEQSVAIPTIVIGRELKWFDARIDSQFRLDNSLGRIQVVKKNNIETPSTSSRWKHVTRVAGKVGILIKLYASNSMLVKS
jgi:hypothetical protein